MAIVNIEYKYSTKNKRYHINKLNKTLNAYKSWIKQNIPTNLIIENDEDAKALRKKRTLVRKEIDSVKDCSKAVYSILMGEFNAQKDEILELLEATEKSLKVVLDDYKASKVVIEEKKEEEVAETYEINYKTTSKERYEKIMAFIKQLESEETNNG